MSTAATEQEGGEEDSGDQERKRGGGLSVRQELRNIQRYKKKNNMSIFCFVSSFLISLFKFPFPYFYITNATNPNIFISDVFVIEFLFINVYIYNFSLLFFSLN